MYMNKDSIYSHGYKADATREAREFTTDNYREMLRQLHILEAARDGTLLFTDEGKGDTPPDLVPIDFSSMDIDKEVSDMYDRLRREWYRDEINSWMFNSSNYPSDLAAMTTIEKYHTLSEALENNKDTDPQIAKKLAVTALINLCEEVRAITIQTQQDEMIARREQSEELFGQLL
jgi:hypothetical protein